MLKARLSLLLLMGALIGLFGQGMGYAAGPAFAPKVAASHAMPKGMDCADMASADKGMPRRPCKGPTIACMACVTPMTIAREWPVVERVIATQLAAAWPRSPMLIGLKLAPEPEPPTV